MTSPEHLQMSVCEESTFGRFGGMYLVFPGETYPTPYASPEPHGSIDFSVIFPPSFPFAAVGPLPLAGWEKDTLLMTGSCRAHWIILCCAHTHTQL